MSTWEKFIENNSSIKNISYNNTPRTLVVQKDTGTDSFEIIGDNNID